MMMASLEYFIKTLFEDRLGFRNWDSLLLIISQNFGESAFAYHVGVKCSQLRV